MDPKKHEAWAQALEALGIAAIAIATLAQFTVLDEYSELMRKLEKTMEIQIRGVEAKAASLAEKAKVEKDPALRKKLDDRVVALKQILVDAQNTVPNVNAQNAWWVAEVVEIRRNLFFFGTLVVVLAKLLGAWGKGRQAAPVPTSTPAPTPTPSPTPSPAPTPTPSPTPSPSP